MPNARTLLHGLGTGLLLVLVVPFVVTAAPQVVGAESSHVVLSGSMAPTIHAGDVIVVGEATPARIERGDVITYRQADGDDLITHRVVEVVERDGGVYFRTKGDANERPDEELVPAARVTGVLRFHIPYIGYVITFGGSRTGLLVLLIVPSILFVANETWTLIAAARADRDTESADH